MQLLNHLQILTSYQVAAKNVAQASRLLREQAGKMPALHLTFERDLVSGSHLILGLLQEASIRDPIIISLGAIAGALSRYYLTLWFARRFGTSFPYGTFAINLSGALVMGFFATLVLERVVASSELRLLVAVGFLGSYTTFSTYALDTATLLRTRNQTVVLFYWAGSAVLGVISLEVGSFLARSLL